MDDARLANLLGVTALAAVDRLRPPVDEQAGHGGGAAGALVHLRAWPGESVESLRRVLGISQPATVRTVNRLVADGLLERRPGPDRRTASLVLSDSGRKAAVRVREARAEALQGFLEPLDEDERAKLLPLLERLAASLAGDRGGAVRVCRLCDRGRLLRVGSLPARPRSAAMRRRTAPGRPSALALATAGIGVVGTAYGMARYGYGLLLPDIRRDYGLSTADARRDRRRLVRRLPRGQHRGRRARRPRRAAIARARRRSDGRRRHGARRPLDRPRAARRRRAGRRRERGVRAAAVHRRGAVVRRRGQDARARLRASAAAPAGASRSRRRLRSPPAARGAAHGWRSRRSARSRPRGRCTCSRAAAAAPPRAICRGCGSAGSSARARGRSSPARCWSGSARRCTGRSPSTSSSPAARSRRRAGGCS